MRRVLRWFWVSLLASSGCLRWAKLRLRQKGAVVALVFHRVLNDRDFAQTHSQPEILVRERTFRDLVAYVARDYEMVDIHDAAPGKPGNKLRIVFTFDDGWWDNYSVVLPIVVAYNIPLTIFVCPRLVGESAPFWPERCLGWLRASKPNSTSIEIKNLIETLKKQAPEAREKELARLAQAAKEHGALEGFPTVDRTLSWQQIAEMDRAGIRFGSHTYSHEILTEVSADTVWQQVEGSGAAIELVLGKPCTAFSYPNGNWSASARSVVAHAGFKQAVTVDGYIWTADFDPLTIPRTNVYEDDLVALSGRFSPAMFEYLTIWKPWRRSKLRSRRRASTPPAAVPVAF